MPAISLQLVTCEGHHAPLPAIALYLDRIVLGERLAVVARQNAFR